MNMSKAAMIRELKLRGNAKGYSNYNKEDLIRILGDGTIAMAETAEAKFLEKVRLIMKREVIEAEDVANLQRHTRNREIAQQATLHIVHIAAVHRHPLASTSQLLFRGKARVDTATCDRCRDKHPKYTCETCDYDICNACTESKIKQRNVFNAQVIAQRKASEIFEIAMKKHNQSQLHLHNIPVSKYLHKCGLVADSEKVTCLIPARNNQTEVRSRSQKKSCKYQRCVERSRYSCASCNFDICQGCFKEMKAFADLPRKDDLTVAQTHKTKLLRYVVFSTTEHRYSATEHSFDSSHTTIEGANARAKALFYVENVYGVPPLEFRRDNACRKPFQVLSGGGHKYKYTGREHFGGDIVISVIKASAFRALLETTMDYHY
jgi:hypothetical protein